MRHTLARVVLIALIVLGLPHGALASNTGSLHGQVLDAQTNAPVAGAEVTAVSPSQSATTTTDRGGSFSFLSLAPDTYAVQVKKAGYEAGSQAGITIFADQSSVAGLALSPLIKQIGQVRSRSSSSLLRAGTTSDVYSVNSAGQQAATSLAGAGSLNQAYGAITGVPGAYVPSNQQGWYQNVYIRGGDSDQVAYEFDGLPVVRQSDLAPIVTLSNLGQQEVQVYTGGTPASSDSSGLAGYINQVIKTGTRPGYVDLTGSLGGPAFYHKLGFEAAGASPNRNFSFYVGTAAADQDYRYGSQFNDTANPLYFYPLSIPSGNAVYNVLDCSGANAMLPKCGAQFSPGASYAQASNFDRETVANLHFGIPHKHGGGRDDVQALFVTGNIATQFYSSAGEIGSAPVSYIDSSFYNGPLLAAPDPTQVVNGPFPSSPAGRPLGATVDPAQRDGSSNGFSIAKLAFQHNINDRSYLRVLGYGEYTDWFINGPTSAFLTFGAELADYEVLGHVYGGNLTYANQLSSKHLVTLSTSYTTQKLQTYNALFNSVPGPGGANPGPGVGSTGLGTIVSSYVDAAGNCYNYATGAPWSCFDAGSQGGNVAQPDGTTAFDLTPGSAPAGSAAAAAGAHFVMTENGHAAQVDDVTPFFSSVSLTDVFQPGPRLTINAGVRYDSFVYRLGDLAAGYPARQFWFDAYNREHCAAPGQAPVSTFNPATGTFGGCPAGYAPMTTPGLGLVDVPATTTRDAVFQPRAAFTYTLDPDTILRGSYGKYARPTATSYKQYNTVQQDLPDFIGQFYALGYRSPDHDIHPDTSDNYDFSLEKHVRGSDLSFKLSPFYRRTRNQLQYLSIDALGGTLAGINVGAQTATGVELAVQKGDFSRDGLAFSLSYTHTDAKVRFSPLPNGVTVLDNLNNAIAQYNSYTQDCAGTAPGAANYAACGAGLYAGNAAPQLTNAGGMTIANPYYGAHAQPLLDPHASYTPYDVFPSPFNAANGYSVPDVASLIVNYRHKRLALTPTLSYSSGGYYGSPLTVPGYVPQSCTADPAATPQAPGSSCSGQYTLPSGATATPGVLFLPDPYTGRFDSLGSLRQPAQLIANLQATYELSKHARLSLIASNLYNKCFQRGYAWDDPNTCVYSTLPSNILPPAGNFVTNPPVQLAYPYGTWFNITEVGASSVRQPVQITVNLDVRL